MKTVSVLELKALFEQGKAPTVIDVREGFELDRCKLPDTRHIPLGQLPHRLADLDPSMPYIIMCKVGGRSAQAVAFLDAQGFVDVSNLTGGINEWSRSVDPTVPLY